MESISYICAFFIYMLFEYTVRKMTFNTVCKGSELRRSQWKKGKEVTLFLSPGYWFARYFKNKIATYFPDIECEIRKQYLKAMNWQNLCISIVLTFSFLLLSHVDVQPSLVVSGFLVFRFVSRTWEITYAFTQDVLSQTNRSRLNKYERIRLAFSSYIELFFLSAPIYLIFGVACNAVSSISVSLSVGTLTNVGLVVSNGAPMVSNLVFIQVFSTLSLVVFSLAMYLSREN